jgi:glutathione peroxidase
MGLLDVAVRTGDGEEVALGALLDGRRALLVNVASGCGLTPQYEALQALQVAQAASGFTVVAFPCNQFGGQEPGTTDEVLAFCSSQYGVTFPVLDKVEVNGPGRHPLWASLCDVPDGTGTAGEVQWNFEKFVVSADGTPVARFRPLDDPLSQPVLAAVAAAAGVPATTAVTAAAGRQ